MALGIGAAGWGAIATGLSAASSITTGVTSANAQRKGRRDQREAQNVAVATAASEQRKSDEALAAANRKAPDVGSLLTAEQQARLKGPSTSLLTGSAGVDPNRLKLGRASLLGG